MSKTKLAELCALSQVLPGAVDITAGGARERGKVLHQYLEDVATVGPVEALQRVPEAYLTDAQAIDLDSMPHSQPGQWAVEVAYAYRASDDTARELHRGGQRDYSMVLPDETPGTADLVAVTDTEVVVLDVKTGYGPLDSPDEAPQLLGLLLAASRAHNKPEGTVGWIRLVDGMPRFQSRKISMLDLDTRVRSRIEGILEGVRRTREQWATAPETVEPRYGPHCTQCPGRFRCPAQAQLAVEVYKAALGDPKALDVEVPKEKRPDFYRAVGAIGALHKHLKDHLDLMALDEPIPLGDGNVYGRKAEKREFLDAFVTEKVLREHAPELVDNTIIREARASKDSLRQAVRALPALPPGQKQTTYVKHLLSVLRANGATFEKEFSGLKAHKPKPPELPEGETTTPAEETAE